MIRKTLLRHTNRLLRRFTVSGKAITQNIVMSHYLTSSEDSLKEKKLLCAVTEIFRVFFNRKVIQATHKNLRTLSVDTTRKQHLHYESETRSEIISP